jgi:hypothetical protein
VTIYGIANNTDNNQGGFPLGTFTYADLVTAGKTGLTIKAGNKGSISLETDGNGLFFASWNGGLYNATGQGIFTKLFNCTFTK